MSAVVSLIATYVVAGSVLSTMTVRRAVQVLADAHRPRPQDLRCSAIAALIPRYAMQAGGLSWTGLGEILVAGAGAGLRSRSSRGRGG